MSSPIVEVTEDETGPVLPLEITDHIIDYLRGRSTALCNCALTCHAWLPRSRYNLFLKMFIGSFASLEALVSVSRMPHMLPHFKELYQLRLHTSDVWWPPESRHVMRPITDRPFVHLLPLFFPQLLQTAKVLKICFTDWSAFPSHPATQFHQSTLPSLTHLTLNSCTFGSLNQCVRLISAFPSLSHLSLFDIAWHNHGSIGTACYAPRPVLQSFELKGIHPERDMIILEWISMAHQKAHSLRHLDLELSDPHSETLDPRSETLRRIALSIGLHLRSLHIRSYADDAGYKSLFAACSDLLSLGISIHRSELAMLVEYLSVVTSRRLRYLHLKIWTTPDEEQILSEDELSLWKVIDDVLVREQFASLEAVILEWCFQSFSGFAAGNGFNLPPREADDIRRIVPKLRAKGIVTPRMYTLDTDLPLRYWKPRPEMAAEQLTSPVQVGGGYEAQEIS